MRYRNSANGIEVSVVTGTHAVLLSMHMAEADTDGLLGFAIEREDHTEKEKYFLKGFKYFQETGVKFDKSQLFSTYEHPVQAFFWEDFTAKPEHTYTYTITPVSGKPRFLKYGKPCAIKVATEAEYGSPHSVFFNRGVAGSLAYARKFKDQPPSKMDAADRQKAFEWLSRGLKEALLAFIDEGKKPGYGLRACLYEFKYPEVLRAFADSSKTGDVRIIYDSRKEKQSNDKAISAAKVPRKILIRRATDPNRIQHNKFIILMEGEKPIAVWTGSTNITDKGIFGQCNTGHVVRGQEEIQQKYLEYWNDLSKDPQADDIKHETGTIQKDLTAKQLKDDITVFFSPRQTPTLLQTYADLLDGATGMVCGTFPFSFDERIQKVLGEKSNHLKYVLMDKKGNAKFKASDQYTLVAYGTYLKDGLYDWLKEVSAGKLFKPGTDFIHNKILLVDPFSEYPTMAVGSANYSANSVLSSDENTLVIRGDKRAADIYITEFFRIFNHYYARDIAVQMHLKKSGENPIVLKTDSSWVKDFYPQDATESAKSKRKQIFRAMIAQKALN